MNNKDEIKFQIVEDENEVKNKKRLILSLLKHKKYIISGTIIFILLIIIVPFISSYLFSNDPIIDGYDGELSSLVKTPSISINLKSPLSNSHVNTITNPPRTNNDNQKEPAIITPELKEIIYMDLNGDQTLDEFEIHLIESGDVVWPEGYPKPIRTDIKPFVRATINEQIYELELVDGIVYDYIAIPFRLENGNFAVSLEVDLGGSGGSSYFYVITIIDNKLELLPLPRMKEEKTYYGGGYQIGFDVSMNFIDNYKAEIVCTETNFKEVIPIDVDIYWGEETIKDAFYDDNGKLRREINYDDVADHAGGVTEVSNDKYDYININQSIYIDDKWGYIGSLSTTLSWDKDMNLKIIKQEAISSKQ